MEELFRQIGKLIANKNASEFKIMGYKHLSVIVKLIYHDCNEYFIANYSSKHDGSFDPLVRMGYGPDRDTLEEVKKWVSEWKALEEEIPEGK